MCSLSSRPLFVQTPRAPQTSGPLTLVFSTLLEVSSGWGVPCWLPLPAISSLSPGEVVEKEGSGLPTRVLRESLSPAEQSHRGPGSLLVPGCADSHSQA